MTEWIQAIHPAREAGLSRMWSSKRVSNDTGCHFRPWEHIIQTLNTAANGLESMCSCKLPPWKQIKHPCVKSCSSGFPLLSEGVLFGNDCEYLSVQTASLMRRRDSLQRPQSSCPPSGVWWQRGKSRDPMATLPSCTASPCLRLEGTAHSLSGCQPGSAGPHGRSKTAWGWSTKVLVNSFLSSFFSGTCGAKLRALSTHEKETKNTVKRGNSPETIWTGVCWVYFYPAILRGEGELQRSNYGMHFLK